VLDLANETTTNGTKVILANKKDHGKLKLVLVSIWGFTKSVLGIDPDSQLWRWKGFNIESVKAGKVRISQQNLSFIRAHI
jgi:hypothetical protein